MFTGVEVQPMREIHARDGIPDPIAWVICNTIREELCISAEFTFDQPIHQIVPDLDETQYLCEELHKAFSHKRDAKRLEPDFVAIIRNTSGACTLEDLAHFIDANYEVVRIRPTTILGQPCSMAGAFFAIEQIAHQIDPDIQRFAPSTVIKHRIRGRRLRQFLIQIYLLTCGKGGISRRVRIINALVAALTLLSIPFVLGLMILLLFQIPIPKNPTPTWPFFFFSGVLMIGTALICLGLQALFRYAMDEIIGVFPSRSYTFRDLAQDVAKSYSDQ